MGEDQKRDLDQDLKNVENTIRIYSNLKHIIFNTDFKGEYAYTVSESLNHIQDMLERLSQERKTIKEFLEPQGESLPPKKTAKKVRKK